MGGWTGGKEEVRGPAGGWLQDSQRQEEKQRPSGLNGGQAPSLRCWSTDLLPSPQTLLLPRAAQHRARRFLPTPLWKRR